MDTGLAADVDGRHPAGAAAGQIEEQFEKAYLRLRDPIFHYLRRFVTDDDDAAELTAQTFERAWTRLSSYRGERDSLGAWLFRIARSQAVDAIRRRRPANPIDLIRPEKHPHSERGRPEPELIQREEDRELAEHVQQLAPLQRECLALRYGSGLSAREIGIVIGKSEAATQKLISRALSRLRETYS
ncbi:MAG TPA: sigma-70 family RNA polymerase sigma factor [Coriobacteriia bacterium]|nr:sigma-70 family RNA polymerase sigma factor [Coriobacteriia bacterium]